MPSEPNKVSRTVALLTYLGLLFAAMLLVIPDPRSILIAYMFPLGIAMLFRTPSEGTGTVLPAIGYIIYFVFFILFTAFRERPRFYILCGAFIIFLLLNVAGCRKMVGAFQSVT